MVHWQSVLLDICDHVVSLDFPETSHRPAIKSGMEIFVADQYAEFAADNIDGDYGLVFLSPHPLKRGKAVL